MGIGRRLRERARWHLGLGSALERLGELEQELRTTNSRHEDLRRRVRDIEELAAASAWTPLLAPSSTLISIVMPTRNRAQLLPGAVATILTQSHANWELLIVDDASDDDTPAVIEQLGDPRIRGLRSTGGPGASIARAVALEHARGEIVAYLDDDNLMAPGWLHTVACAFDRDPALELAYGAQVREDADGRPGIEFVPWDRALLERHNFMDQNVIAHRRGLAGMHYDPALKFCSDWDMALRATRDTTPLAIPAIAVIYRVDAPGRLSEDPAASVMWHEIAQRARAADPA